MGRRYTEMNPRSLQASYANIPLPARALPRTRLQTRPVVSLHLAAKSFHEKAGMSQVRFSLFLFALLFVLSVFSFLPVDSSHSSQAAPVAILPSALLVERFSLGAWWAFPIQ
jgi:hypothetical protein